MKHSSTWFALILIPLALLLSAANKSQSAKPLPRESAVHPTNQSAYDEQRSPTNHQVTNGRVIGSPVSSVQAEQQSADNRAATDGQNKPDWMVRLTFVLCVITALQALTFWIQYRAMVFSERAQIIVIAARAPAAPSRLVLAVGPSVPATTATPPIATAPAQPIVPDGLTAFAVGQHSKFQATILNVGKTPAYKFRCECWMELV